MRLLIVGVGQIGSRHLQAAARCAAVSEIRIVEPVSAMREIARARWIEASGRPGGPIEYANLDEVPDSWADVAIVATTAQGRREVVERLLRKDVARFLVEKPAFDRIDDYDDILARAGQRELRVNCVYRYVPVFAAIRERTSRGAPFELSVEAGDIGLSTNLPHWLDLLAYLSGHPVRDVRVELAGSPRASKRGKDLVEFAGKAAADAGAGKLRAVCAGAPKPPRFRVTTPDFTVEIDEADGTVVGDPVLAAYGFKPPMVSQTTTLALAELSEGRCRLPALSQAAAGERAMLRAFARCLGLGETERVPVS